MIVTGAGWDRVDALAKLRLGELLRREPKKMRSRMLAWSMAATFTVVATGTGPLNYQWEKNGVAISGATTATYATPPATTADDGSQFDVVVSNSVRAITSNRVLLTVISVSAPVITTQPASQTVNAGQTATFAVVASGTAPLSYQWLKNGTVVPGATSASYTTP